MNTIVKQLLLRLGTPKLVELYGRDEIEFVAEISDGGISANSLVDLIDKKYGSQFLANREIRRCVLQGLDDDSLIYIARDERPPVNGLTQSDADRLFEMKWGRTQLSSRRLIEVLKLDESYLPPEKIIVPSSIDVKPHSVLYPHQLGVKGKLISSLLTGTGRVMVHMPTGAGKTRTSIDAVFDYWKLSGLKRKNIIWLAHSEELCEQAFETFCKIWTEKGDCEVQIVRFWGGHQLPESVEEGAVIVAGFQKLYSLISSSEDESFIRAQTLKTSSQIIIVDEAHKAIAPTYKACIEFMADNLHCKIIGLTATPGRTTNDIFEQSSNDLAGSTAHLAEFFDHNKIGMTDENGIELEDPIGYLQELGFLSKIQRRKVHTNFEMQLNDREKEFISRFLELPSSVLTQLANSAERNALILGEIADLYLRGKSIIVFALSVKHASAITDLLNIKNIPAKSVDGTTSTHERQEAISLYKSGEIKVLVNYGVLTTGFDAPNTNAVVIARPTASIVLYSQMIGRGIRGARVGGNDECILVDVIDNILGFPSESQAFNHFNQAWS